MENNKIIKYAQNNFKKIDGIINLYTMTFVFVSKKIAKTIGYTQNELIDKRVRDVVMIDYTSLITSGSKDSKKDIKTLITKDGKKVKSTADIKPFKFEGEDFIVILNMLIN